MAGMPPTTDAQTTAAAPTTLYHVASQSLSRNRYDTHVTIADGTAVPVMAGDGHSYLVSTTDVNNLIMKLFPVNVIDSSSTSQPPTSQVIIIT